MNPEIYYERSSKSPKLHKSVQKTPESARSGSHIKSYRRSSQKMNLEIQSKTKSAGCRTEEEFRGIYTGK